MYTTAITVHLFSSQTIFLTFTYSKKAKVTDHFSIGNLRIRNDLYDIFAQYILYILKEFLFLKDLQIIVQKVVNILKKIPSGVSAN